MSVLTNRDRREIEMNARQTRESRTIQDLMKQNTRLREVADAARNLAYFCRHSLNTGPISKNPRGEAVLWRALRLALQALDNKVDGI